jgi:hypothetical protein
MGLNHEKKVSVNEMKRKGAKRELYVLYLIS